MPARSNASQGLQQQPLLRVHGQRLARRDAEERGVELGAPARKPPDGRRRAGSGSSDEVPAAVGGEVGDGVAAVARPAPTGPRGGRRRRGSGSPCRRWRSVGRCCLELACSRWRVWCRSAVTRLRYSRSFSSDTGDLPCPSIGARQDVPSSLSMKAKISSSLAASIRSVDVEDRRPSACTAAVPARSSSPRSRVGDGRVRSAAGEHRARRARAPGLVRASPRPRAAGPETSASRWPATAAGVGWSKTSVAGRRARWPCEPVAQLDRGQRVEAESRNARSAPTASRPAWPSTAATCRGPGPSRCAAPLGLGQARRAGPRTPGSAAVAAAGPAARRPCADPGARAAEAPGRARR